MTFNVENDAPESDSLAVVLAESESGYREITVSVSRDEEGTVWVRVTTPGEVPLYDAALGVDPYQEKEE